jgi:hypothetical protein
VGSPIPLTKIAAPLLLGDELGNTSVKRMLQCGIETCGTLISPCTTISLPFLDMEVEMDQGRSCCRLETEEVIVQDAWKIISGSVNLPQLIPCRIPGQAVFRHSYGPWTGFSTNNQSRTGYSTLALDVLHCFGLFDERPASFRWWSLESVEV